MIRPKVPRTVTVVMPILYPIIIKSDIYYSIKEYLYMTSTMLFPENKKAKLLEDVVWTT